MSDSLDQAFPIWPAISPVGGQELAMESNVTHPIQMSPIPKDPVEGAVTEVLRCPGMQTRHGELIESLSTICLLDFIGVFGSLDCVWVVNMLWMMGLGSYPVPGRFTPHRSRMAATTAVRLGAATAPMKWIFVWVPWNFDESTRGFDESTRTGRDNSNYMDMGCLKSSAWRWFSVLSHCQLYT